MTSEPVTIQLFVLTLFALCVALSIFDFWMRRRFAHQQMLARRRFEQDMSKAIQKLRLCAIDSEIKRKLREAQVNEMARFVSEATQGDKDPETADVVPFKKDQK